MASIPKWTIEFDPAAQRELDRLDRPIARRTSKFLHERVSQLDNPHKIGERLTGAQRFLEIPRWRLPHHLLSRTIGLWCWFFASGIAEKSINVSNPRPLRSFAPLDSRGRLSLRNLYSLFGLGLPGSA
jgi:hypothetical protein